MIFLSATPHDKLINKHRDIESDDYRIAKWRTEEPLVVLDIVTTEITPTPACDGGIVDRKGAWAANVGQAEGAHRRSSRYVMWLLECMEFTQKSLY